MDADEPKRRWYLTKRSWAALAVLLAGFYLLTFIPTCWALVRIDPETHPTAWAIIAAYDRPSAALLTVCPENVRSGVVAAVNFRRPEYGWKMSCQRLPSGPTIGFYKKKSSGAIADVRLW